MIARQLQVCCLCIGIVTMIFLESAFGINNFLNSRQGLEAGLIVVDAIAQDPFDPTFMDPGNFNAEKIPSPGIDNCKPDNIDCNSTWPYRTYDGTCNNLAHPSWGKAEECHPRILEAYYEGEYDFRRSVKGGPLPSPRSMVLKEFGNRDRPTHDVSLFFSIFGQMMSHDVTRLDMQLNVLDLYCCSGENARNTSLCAPIYVSPSDPYYSQFNITCLELPRTLVCNSCKSDKRQTLNNVTSALDGSLFYGNSEEKALNLRTLDGTGRMKVEKTEHGELLPRPQDSDPTPQFCPEQDKFQCFDSGDARTNQHSTLVSVQTLFVREHNNVVDCLGKLNPAWDDETRFQEARRIVAAELQNVVYSEYLPAVLGSAHMSHYNLSVNTDNKGTRYDPSVRIGIWNEFSTSIFRLHSMVATMVGFDHHRFKDYYSNSQLLREGKMDGILQGTCKVPSQKNDHWFISDVTCHLYQSKYLPFGEDLVSIDLQRGRDNGIPPYVDMLRHLTKGRINASKFCDLWPVIPWRNIRLLRELYKDVRDVDLFAGALLEDQVPGSHLGPTAASIASMQFNNIKFGDRFYFEHQGEAGSFSPAQREILKKTTLARIMCDNLNIQKIQKNPLYLESEKNPLLKCDEIPPLDLSLWKMIPD